MAQIGLEDIYPAEVAEYGHMRVGVTQELVLEQYVVKGVTTQGELRDTTRRLLRDEAVQMQVNERLAALPDGYDPWIWLIERRRALRARYGDELSDD
ncbi:hypothetical protein [Klebsiella pneumoniae]|uniref:hypothetical protein n=1 Tax=Klebsiella pneumoniae TaxID=573 RepID=UPI0032DB9907